MPIYFPQFDKNYASIKLISDNILHLQE